MKNINKHCKIAHFGGERRVVGRRCYRLSGFEIDHPFCVVRLNNITIYIFDQENFFLWPCVMWHSSFELNYFWMNSAELSKKNYSFYLFWSNKSQVLKNYNLDGLTTISSLLMIWHLKIVAPESDKNVTPISVLQPF